MAGTEDTGLGKSRLPAEKPSLGNAIAMRNRSAPIGSSPPTMYASNQGPFLTDKRVMDN